MGGQMSVLFDGKIKSAFNLVDAKLKALWYSFLFFCLSKPRDTRPFSRKINHAISMMFIGFAVTTVLFACLSVGSDYDDANDAMYERMQREKETYNEGSN